MRPIIIDEARNIVDLNLYPIQQGSTVELPTKSTTIRIPWSSNARLKNILYIFKHSQKTFYGVEVEYFEDRRNEMLWLVKEEGCLQAWQEFRQGPWITNGECQFEMNKIIGHYEAESGDIQYAVKWYGYCCPTWEHESALVSHLSSITTYYKSLNYLYENNAVQSIAYID